MLAPIRWITLLVLIASPKVLAAQELRLETATGALSGTLELPNGNGPFPVALIIAGSGPTDRDGNNPNGLKTNAYKLLAEGLAKNGVASLRYDKRGIGKSSSAATREEDLRFETYVNDAVAWLEKLGQDSRFSKRFVIGHSEGSLIGILAAQQVYAQNKPIAGFVSIAGAGRAIDEILIEQLKPQLSADQLEESRRILGELKAGRSVANPAEKLPAQLAAALFRPSVQPYLISWFRYDPALEIAKLKIPSLVVQGSTDIQVNLQDAERLAAASKQKPLLIEGMNHVFKTATLEGASQNAAYTNPDLPLAAKLLETILEFFKRT
jgi:uncharacterized protein